MKGYKRAVVLRVEPVVEERVVIEMDQEEATMVSRLCSYDISVPKYLEGRGENASKMANVLISLAEAIREGRRG